MHQRVDLQLRLVERVLLIRWGGRLDHFGSPEIACALEFLLTFQFKSKSGREEDVFGNQK